MLRVDVEFWEHGTTRVGALSASLTLRVGVKWGALELGHDPGGVL